MQLEKLVASFKNCSGPYPWRDFLRLLGQLGYEQTTAGKTGGSRRKHFNAATKHLLMLDEPHSGQMGFGMVKRLRKELEDKGVI